MSLALLAQIRLFSCFSADELGSLSRQLKPVAYHRNQPVFHQGEEGDTLFIIREGRVKISTVSEHGREAILALLGPGDIFGELAVLDRQPRSATATAIEPAEVLTLGRESFLSFLRNHPEAAIQAAIALAARLRRTDGIVGDIVFLDLPTRLAKRLLELAREKAPTPSVPIQLSLPLTQSELASMVGTARQSVNRVLASWQDAGLVRLQKQGIVILDPDELQRRYL